MVALVFLLLQFMNLSIIKKQESVLHFLPDEHMDIQNADQTIMVRECIQEVQFKA